MFITNKKIFAKKHMDNLREYLKESYHINKDEELAIFDWEKVQRVASAIESLVSEAWKTTSNMNMRQVFEVPNRNNENVDMYTRKRKEMICLCLLSLLEDDACINSIAIKNGENGEIVYLSHLCNLTRGEEI